MKPVNKILKEKGVVFPKDIILKFKTKKGEIIEFPARKGTLYFEKKDVLKIIRILRKENRMLEKFVDISGAEEWDLELIHKEILEGTNYGIEIKPDKKFAEWFRKRFDLEKI